MAIEPTTEPAARGDPRADTAADPRADTWMTAAPSSRPQPVIPGEGSLHETGGSSRYLSSALLGSGGMGEVRLCRDERIGRDVAMKVMRRDVAEREDAHRRFVREARVQGQLEHPAVVPVYDLGVGEDGAAWFTMKRVRGRTLGEILDGIEHGDETIRARWGRRRLLSAFSSLCLAVDFANARGVIHRDLKPGNVMLGDFGEVYLLDWGLAKLVGEGEARTAPAPSGESAAASAGESAAVSAGDGVVDRIPLGGATLETQGGAIFGTPGYMAPEQVRGETLGPAADVYALGALLFELLAGEPLHRGDTSKEVMVSTLDGVDARPSLRASGREIPPELDAVCQRATALDPAERYPTARALHEDVERFLDGDRDIALRRELATRHARDAESAAERAARAADAHAEQEERATALREAGRALALDPRSGDAVRTMMRLMMNPPSRLPPEAETELVRAADLQQRLAARSATFVYLSWLLFTPAVVLLGLRSGAQALTSLLLMSTAAGLSALAARVRARRSLLVICALLVSSVGIATASRSLGPFITVPSIAVANTLCFLITGDRQLRMLVVACGLAILFGPLALEYAGVLPHTYAFRDGAMVILPQMHDLPEAGTVLFLCFANAGILVFSSLFVIGVRSAMVAAERRNQLFAWNLARFLPDSALAGITPPAAPAPAGDACILEETMGRARR